MPGIVYHDKELLLEPGEVLAIYTDGMIEQHGLGDADFGLDRLIGVIKAHVDSGVQVALDRSYRAVADFTGEGEQYDDQTMVLFAIKRG
jgi:sigma-B regulation protein RsbU (phosphoserine phosphatase)